METTSEVDELFAQHGLSRDEAQMHSGGPTPSFVVSYDVVLKLFPPGYEDRRATETTMLSELAGLRCTPGTARSSRTRAR
ncbi:hypothetical protein NLX83_26745 [Allokutzneria sp. A3M-2-11 16]|uniref:hypothetical protein n=1 Tax=Allokutzneria sp. A3M-2-11 16 TaxID=2962043 RepID=UPI0020B84474|nr:hypothetical protein [Allokutzneria sp. A3M-2-11 16]MCP3802879.1 hypothetical protein [Allokutzneria sp. A3M-2-11 16]